MVGGATELYVMRYYDQFERDNCLSKHIQPADSHGSLKDIQRVVNERPELIAKELCNHFKSTDFETIEWVSPLAEKSFAEYRDQDFITELRLRPERMVLEDFWPQMGPQWDALGTTSKGQPILVEAKANIPELVSPPSGAGKESLDSIEKSLQMVKDYLAVSDKVNWAGKFYQYTNRLAHLYFLRVLNGIPAFLVFVYFINDRTVSGPTSSQEWAAAIKVMKTYLGIGRNKLEKYTADVFIDVQDLEIRR